LPGKAFLFRLTTKQLRLASVSKNRKAHNFFKAHAAVAVMKKAPEQSGAFDYFNPA
jgi:hypothetical protein